MYMSNARLSYKFVCAVGYIYYIPPVFNWTRAS